MKRKRIAGVCITLAAVVLAGTFAVSGNNTKDKNHVEIINVSYDPTREFYEAYNKIFSKYWKEETGQSVDVIQSHGGSGKQALEIPTDFLQMWRHLLWNMILMRSGMPV